MPVRVSNAERAVQARRALPVFIQEKVRIPAEVVDLDSFCRWISEQQFPPQFKASYLRGEIWVEWIDGDVHQGLTPGRDPRREVSGLVPSPAPPSSRRRPAFRVIVNEAVWIPSYVVDLDSFCHWACSEQFPDRGRVSYLRGEIWVDLSMEEMYTHNRVKTKFTIVVGGLAESAGLGVFLDGMLLRNSQANLSTVPDGVFVSYDTLRGGRVRRLEGTSSGFFELDGSPDMVSGFFELDGSPDMVLEVVSAHSVRKDTVDLKNSYWQAGIREYWLVDARAEPVRFDILKHGARGYTATRRQAGGWLKSAVFGRSFRLTRQVDPLGDPQYTLAVRR
jgi:Uma2 family endonuclease